jgi:predicted phage terminase large subunit-like protein
MACLDSLATFAETFGPSGYQAAAVHRLIASKLEQCYAKKIRRLAISCPPRHGKSLLTTVLFPAWSLTKNPELEIMTASYGSTLAEKFSVHTKNTLTSPGYRQLFPPIVAADQNRLGDWQTIQGGSLFATSVGASGTGRGADALIIDDFCRNAEDAASEVNRDLVWNWFNMVAMTRLAPDGVAIIVATRWSLDDLVGRLTSPDRIREFEDAGCADARWETLNLEAICEHPDRDPMGRQMGEALWENWPVSSLLEKKTAIGARAFAALYQGNPMVAGGSACDFQKLRYIDGADVPKGLRIVRAWDLAVGTAVHNDYSVGVKIGVDHKSGSVFILDVVRRRFRWPDMRSLITSIALQEKKEAWKIAIESVGAFANSFNDVKTDLRGEVRVEGVSPTECKETRFQPLANRIDASLVYLVRAPWNSDFVSEVSQFPNGAHDDQCDAAAHAFNLANTKPQNLLMALGDDDDRPRGGYGLHASIQRSGFGGGLQSLHRR